MAWIKRNSVSLTEGVANTEGMLVHVQFNIKLCTFVLQAAP